MLTTIDNEKLFTLLKTRYLPQKADRDIAVGSVSSIDKHILPSVFVYEAHGIRLQADTPFFDGQVLDFCGQTVTCLLGQNDPWVTANIMAFMASGHPSFLSTSLGQKIYYEVPRLFREITKMGPDAYVNHRLNNGSDAIDFAINLAFTAATGRKRTLIAFTGSYHGQGHLPYGISELQAHLRFCNSLDVLFLDAPTHTEDIDQVTQLSVQDEKTLAELRRVAKEAFAVIIEPIQFNNNGNTPSKPFMRGLREVCSELNVPLIFDEVQTAWGWLGVMTAAERYGVWPDIMAVSKSITSGYGPLAAVIAQAQYQQTSAFGARTNGADVRSLVAAKAVAERLLGTTDVPHKLKQTRLGKELQKGLLHTFPAKSAALLHHLKVLREEINTRDAEIKIGAIKGDGLARMIEIKTKTGAFDSQLTTKVQQQLLINGGVFVRTPSNVREIQTLFIKMPIVATEQEMSVGFDRMKQVMLQLH